MSKRVLSVPLSEVEWIRLYVGKCKKTLAQAMAENGADYALNGGMWNPDGTPCPLLKAEGTLLSGTPWVAYGYGWETGEDIKLYPHYRYSSNFIACTCLIAPWGPVVKPGYGSAMGGRRGRSAMGIRDGCLMLYCAGDGTADASTPEELRDELHAAGWESAVMLDGGGSSQCDFGPEGRITSTRKVHNIILVKLKREEEKPVDGITVKFMTKNPCYTNGRTITPKGIMVHSTAAPGATAAQLRTQWDRVGAETSVHAFVDDTVTLQALPWTARAWHSGGGANNTHISFEICEPQACRLIPLEWVPLRRGSAGWAVTRLQEELAARGYDPNGIDGSFGPGCEAALKDCQKALGLSADGSCGPATLAALAKREGSFLAYDPRDTAAYFEAAWDRAVYLCALLCRTYGLNPEADIISHAEGYQKGVASNHADVGHWFPLHGKSMDDFRAAVRAAMTGGAPAPVTDRQKVQERFGLEDATMDYLEAYKYGSDLLKKLAGGK